jgi:ATPase subunit of ABC transporter with duplicated ATPase domains
MEGVAKQKAILDRYNELAMNYSDETADEMTKLQDEIEAKGLWDLDSKVDQAMDALRCPPDDADVTKLSGGERRRVALCRCCCESRTAAARRADQPSRRRVGVMARRPSAQLSGRHPDRHPRPLLPRQRHRLDSRARPRPRHSLRGQLHVLAGQKQKRLEQEGREEEARQRTLAREQEWIAPRRARQAKSKARYERYEELLKQGRREADPDRADRHSGRRAARPERHRFRGPQKGLRRQRLLIDDLTFKLPPGGIVGVIGPNGAGKTTLFRMITGRRSPTRAPSRSASRCISAMSTSRATARRQEDVWEEISGGNDQLLLGKREVNSRAYCSAFNFKGADQQKKVGALSGGERNRVHLAKMLKSGANVLLLDEPTNDLDVDTLRALEEALEDFAGCAVIISHDRWFLDRIATHILAFEGDSHVEWFEGNFQDYEKDKMRRLGTGFDHPAPDEVQEIAQFDIQGDDIGIESG